MKYIMTKEMAERFFKYLDGTCGRSLHIVTDDLNTKYSHVKFCIEYAKQNSDHEGEFLAREMLKMSKSQRIKLARGGYFKGLK